MNNIKIRFYSWLLIMLGLTASLLWALTTNRFVVESNILRLFPAHENNALVEEAVDRIGEGAIRHWFFLVGSTDEKESLAAAASLEKGLRQISSFETVGAGISDEASSDELGKLFWQHRRGLLSEQDRKRIEEQGSQILVDQALATLYSPLAIFDENTLQHDPLFIFSRYLNDVQGSQSWQIKNGYPAFVYKKDNAKNNQSKTYILLSAVLADSPFSMSQQNKVLPEVDQLIEKMQEQVTSVDFLDLSSLRFAAHGVKQARAEISTIGLGSALGIVILLCLVFRSGTPLGLSLFAILCGYLAAVSICWLVFGVIHLFVLVMGSSLLGLCNDYAMHFFVDRQAHAENWQAKDTLRRILPALTLAMITSIMAFMGMLVAPFPGLQQLALFSASGLFITYLTVVCLFPYILTKSLNNRLIKTRLKTQQNIFIELCYSLFKKMRQPPVQIFFRIVLIVGLLVSLWFLPRLTANDDVRLLQNQSDTLLSVQNRWKKITGESLTQQLFLVTGKSTESILQKEELLAGFLSEQLAQKNIQAFQALSSQIPSVLRQQKNRDSVLRVLDDKTTLNNYSEQSGIPQNLLIDYQNYLQSDDWLELDNLSNYSASLSLDKRLIDDLPGGLQASVVSITQAVDVEPLIQWADAHEHIVFIDHASMVSRLFQQYRQHAAWVLVLAYLAIALFLSQRYGWRRCFWVMLPPLSAAVFTLAVMGAAGQAINLFHCLGLMLVLGAGIDYTLFLQESSQYEDETQTDGYAQIGGATCLTILLSASTTILSFGLLALSQTAAVSALGLTVLLGISFSVLLAPLAVVSVTVVPVKVKK